MARRGGKTLITGGSGRLGKWLKAVFPGATFPLPDELDIENEASVMQYVERFRPDTIIHAAALTNASECEKDKEKAWAVNVSGTERLLKHALLNNKCVYFIYVSTAGVFGGEEGNYVEDSVPYPRNFYCFTKYVAEERIRSCKNVCIVRTNFIDKANWPYASAFSDRFGTYLLAPDVAIGLRDIAAKKPKGIIHLCGDARMSLYDAARKVDPSVAPASSESFHGPLLPKDMSLKTKNWKPYRFGFSLRESSVFLAEGQ